MNNISLNEQETEILVRQLLNIGEAMYKAGAEISRIEDSLHRLGKAYGAKYVSVYAITARFLAGKNIVFKFENLYYNRNTVKNRMNSD